MHDIKTIELSQYLSSAEELIEEARNGRMFILVDDESRENEGDLVVPAQFATPDAVNFMARHARGLRERRFRAAIKSMTGDGVDTARGLMVSPFVFASISCCNAA